MTTPRITFSVKDHIGFVELNRADKCNALDMAMFHGIDSTIKAINKRRDVRVVIVSGAGESFCSGLDVKAVLANRTSAIRLLWKWLPGNANLAQRVSVGWRRLDIPVIMVLHGKCWGGGLQIALGGDFRIASPDCSLSIMESRWGLIPDMGGTIGLRECVAADHAIKLAMTSEVVCANTALQLGLVTQVAETPKEHAVALAKQLLERSPDTNKKIKRFYHSLWGPKERRILARETLNQIAILFGQNQRIAVKKAQGRNDISYKL